jgi:branched-chain amino acid transport system permease protein
VSVRRLQRLPAPRGAVTRIALLLAALVFVTAFPPVYGNFLSQQFATYLIFGLLALSVGLMSGFARLLNLGVGATFGVAAYCVALLTQRHVYDPIVLFLAANAAGLAVSVLFCIYAVVASGLQYMMLTFLTTLAFFSVPALAPGFTGGDNGLTVKGGLEVSFGLNPLIGDSFYYLVVGAVAASVAVSWYLLSSQAGRAVRAIGRNPVRASAMGYRVGQYRMALTMYCGFLASVAGWLYALQNAFVFQDLLGLQNSLNGLLYALIGGVDTILGPLIGAAGLRYFVESLSKHSTQSSLYIGAALLGVVYFMPEGVVGLIRRGWRSLQARLRPGELAPIPVEGLQVETALDGDEQRVL